MQRLALLLLQVCFAARLSEAQVDLSLRKNNNQNTRVRYRATTLYSMASIGMNPTSVQLVRNPIESSTTRPIYDLVWMSYEPTSSIQRVASVGRIINIYKEMSQSTKTVTDETTIKYPNSVGTLPPNTIDKQPKYVWWIASGIFGLASGFNSNVGGIYLMDMVATKWAPVPIYTEAGVGFHHTEWVDMDLDKHRDCITVKGSANNAQLLWLKQPTTDGGAWTPNPISNGTDVGGTDFRVMRVVRAKSKNKKIMLIIVAGKRSGVLTAHWVDDPDNDWTLTSRLRSTDISGSRARQTPESFVSVEIVDLNGDGIPEVLTSIAATQGGPGQVVAFQVPKGGFDPKLVWRRRTLMEWPMKHTNFYSVFPGPTFKFHVSSYNRQSTKKPHILVSGADRGTVYVLSPNSWSPMIWGYSLQTISAFTKPIGIPAVGDVDGDGNVEIFIPTGNEVVISRYQLSHASIRKPSTWIILCLSLFVFCW